MKKFYFPLSVMLPFMLFFAGNDFRQEKMPDPDWAVNMTVMETCSCPVFCQCFFTGKPPATCSMNMGDDKMMFCRFNQAYKVNFGHYGSIKLDGTMFWFAGDAGEDFAFKKLPWAVLTFDSSVTREQRQALTTILHMIHFYRPDRWNSYTVAKSSFMNWSFTPDTAKATLDNGKTAEVILQRLDGGMNNNPVTMNNMDYFGYPRNSGFLLMPNEVEAYRVGDKAFEYKGTNGLVTTVDMNSGDFKK